MPALAVIEPPNAKAQAVEPKQELADPKRKVKASSLCYTPPAMINDKKRDRSYFRRGLLGEGGFARCFEVTDFAGTRLAAKCIAKKSITSEKIKMKLLGEIKVHKSMNHPNIVRQRDCFEDEINVYMILDICTNGTLMDMLRARKKFTEPEVRYYGLQILGAVKYMHSKRVIHRDLKLGNLFLDEDMCLKVGDFGLAALLVDDNDRKKTICGTPNYIAPEVLFSSPEGHSYEVDLWSIGVIFYAMLVGKPPFQSKDVKAIYAKIKTNEYEFPQSSGISTSAKDLITSLLSTDPDNRPSLDDIACHHFFNTGLMPRSIPASATKDEPIWPEGQASSIFKRNKNYVSTIAGIGQNQIAGTEPGKQVDVIVEQPEMGHYLPVSLSPRVGPAAKMINLKTERAGATQSTLSDRLKSVHLSEAPQADAPLLEHRRVNSLARDRDLRRTTLGAGALRARAVESASITDRKHSERAAFKLGGAHRAEIAAAPVPATSIPAVQAMPRLGSAARVARDSNRAMTRSSRFAQLPVVEDIPEGEKEPIQLAKRASGRLTARESLRLAETRSHSRTSSTDSAAPRVSARASRIKTIAEVEPPQKQVALQSSARMMTEGQGDQNPTERVEGRARRTTSVSRGRARTDANRPKDMWHSITLLAEHLLHAVTGAEHHSPRCQGIYAASDIVHVSKWVDYSNRYGLGYQLSDESTGVYFNDSTSVILQKHHTTFDYIPSESVVQCHTLDSPPKELEKKVYLLKHFKGYMTTHLNSAAVCQSRHSPVAVRHQPDAACYMTHYWRTKQGILFRLSDGTLQFNFIDHSKLMVPMPQHLQDCRVRYIGIDKLTVTDDLSRAMQSYDCRDKVEQMAKLLQEFVRSEGRTRQA